MSSRSRRLRVLLSPSAYFPHVGGIEEITRRLALGLEARGHDVVVCTNRWPDGTARAETLDGVRVRRIPFVLPGRRGLARFCARAPLSAVELLRLARPADVVHLVGAGPNAVYVAALRRALGVPVVLTAQGEFRNDAHRAYERSLSLRYGLRTLLRSADAVTAPARRTLDELGEAFDIRARREVIPNGVAVEEYATAERDGDGLGRYVLATGRLVDEKGFDILLDAFAQARPRLGGRRLVLAGDGHLRGELEAQAARLGLSSDVTFLGSVDRSRVASLLRGADFFALSSRREALPLALFEAMAAGAPAIAAAAGGVAEYAADGVNALVVAPDDRAALADALVRLAEDEALRERLRAGAAETARSLDWERVVERYEALYLEVLRG